MLQSRTHYFVKKELNSYIPLDPEKNIDVSFYASLDPNFIQIRDTVKTRYKNQIGYISCSTGFINNVWVNDGRKQPINARGCGVATVFTTLCLIDPELNLLPSSKIHEAFGRNHRLERTIKKACKRFVGLQMIANPLTGAFAYFTAAINSGYKKMLIRNECGTLKHYKWINTADAKDNYDATTGMIGKIMGREKNWWFCDEVEGQLPKFPSLDPCKN